MSITDLNSALQASTGLEVSDTDLQRRLDLLLIAAITNIAGIGGGNGLSQVQTTAAVKLALETATTVGTSTERTPEIRLETSAFTVTTGCKRLSLAVNGVNPAIILGVSIPAGTTIFFEAPSGDTIGALTGNASGSSVIIAELR
jgi:hypothetical protein